MIQHTIRAMRNAQLIYEQKHDDMQPPVLLQAFNETRIRINWLERESQTIDYLPVAIHHVIPSQTQHPRLLPAHAIGTSTQ